METLCQPGIYGFYQCQTQPATLWHSVCWIKVLPLNNVQNNHIVILVMIITDASINLWLLCLPGACFDTAELISGYGWWITSGAPFTVWIKLDPTINKWIYILWSVRWNYLSIHKLQRLRNGYAISSHTLLGMCLLIHAGIKVDPCQ